MIVSLFKLSNTPEGIYTNYLTGLTIVAYLLIVVYEIYITAIYMISKNMVGLIRSARRVLYIGDIPDFEVANFATFNPLSIIFGNQKYKIWIQMLLYSAILVMSILYWYRGEKNARLVVFFGIFTMLSAFYIMLMLSSLYFARKIIQLPALHLALFDSGIYSSIYQNADFISDLQNYGSFIAFNSFTAAEEANVN